MHATTNSSSTPVNLKMIRNLTRSLTLLIMPAGLLIGQQISITSPVNGTAVTTGQTLTVQVTATGFQAVQLIEQNVTVTPPLQQGPYTFSVTVPTDLIGSLNLIAMGVIGPDNAIFSTPVRIDLETTLQIISVNANLPQVGFSFAGQQIRLKVTGTFSDGSVLDITNSSLTSYSSAGSGVATVDGTGLITATGTGSTSVTVSYGGQSAQVPVSVANSIRGDLNGDGFVDKDDLNIITAALNTPAMKPIDSRDLNADGLINALDARILVTLCSRPACATH